MTMATIRALGRSSNKPDEEFLQQLYRGGELLSQGKVIEARDFLERAYTLQPRHEKGQNLLGLAYFKLGLFDRAADIYEALVRQNPADPTLRVNLGLVYLKTNALQRAIREFETATDLSPDHKKAQNYLGLALAQAGEYGRAREHFLLAGSEAMAEKMGRAIAGESFERPSHKPLVKQPGFTEVDGHEVVAERGGEQVSEVTSLPAGEEADLPVEVDEGGGDKAGVPDGDSTVASQDWGAQLGTRSASVTGFAPVLEPSAGAASAKASLMLEAKVAQVAAQLKAVAKQDSALATSRPETASEAASGSASESASESTSQATGELHPAAYAVEEAVLDAPLDAPLDAYSASALQRSEVGPPLAEGHPFAPVPRITELLPAIQLYTLPLEGPFPSLPDVAAVVVAGEVLTRLSGMVTLAGNVTLTPEPKRSRGRTTDKPFGEGERQVYRARGQGLLTVHVRGHLFLPVDLADESTYFRDETVFAFEEPVMFENGRLNAPGIPDLDLVHLRGKGQVLLQLQGPLRSLAVLADQPVTLPLSHLVGWSGDLSPRLVPLGMENPGKPASRGGVELSGEGFALFAVPV